MGVNKLDVVQLVEEVQFRGVLYVNAHMWLTQIFSAEILQVNQWHDDTARTDAAPAGMRAGTLRECGRAYAAVRAV